MTKTTFKQRAANTVLAGTMAMALIPGVALATDGSTSGTGTDTKTTDSIEVVYEKDCSWTATYPTSVTMATNSDGTASASIDFTVKGLIDVDHQVSITPASETITLTGERHSGTLSASVTGGTAAAADVNSTSGATVSGSASATADAVSAAAVDSYKGTTTFNIQCSKPVVYVATFSDGSKMTWDELKTAYPDAFSDDGKTIIGNTSKSTSYFPSTLTSIVIDDSATSIGNFAFKGCAGLTSVTIGDSVASVGDYAFMACTSLTSLAMPDSVASVGRCAFQNCPGLTAVTVGKAITAISDYTYYWCTGLTSATIDASVNSIGEGAFANCTSLTAVTYSGTRAQWNAIRLDSYWYVGSPITVVHCADGDITIS